VKICVASVPHRSDDVVRANHELKGRLSSIDTEAWNPIDLAKIAKRGFSVLNMDVPLNVVDNLVSNALGSPQIMQALCLTYARLAGVRISLLHPKSFPIDSVNIQSVLEDTSTIADSLTFLKRLHAGPKTKGQKRTIYQLNDGSSGDVYRAILLAMASEPAQIEFSYDQITARVLRICIGASPSGHSISQSLAKMQEIADGKPETTGSFSWGDGYLNVSDPYFMFYLRCSSKLYGLRKAI
jgi:hypothetical protein